MAEIPGVVKSADKSKRRRRRRVPGMETKLEIIRGVESTNPMDRRMVVCEPMDSPLKGCSGIESSSGCHRML